MRENSVDPYRATQACRLASGRRLVAGEEVALTSSAAKYPLLRGWIVRAPPPAPPAEEARRPRGRRGG